MRPPSCNVAFSSIFLRCSCPTERPLLGGLTANAITSLASRPEGRSRTGANGRSVVSRAVYGRRPGRRRSLTGYPPVILFRGHDVRHWHRDRQLDRGARRRLEGDRGCDGIDDVVEIVVVPVPPDPSRVGGISECCRLQTDEQGDDAQHQDPTGKGHGWIIAPLWGRRQDLQSRARAECVGPPPLRRNRSASIVERVRRARLKSSSGSRGYWCLHSGPCVQRAPGVFSWASCWRFPPVPTPARRTRRWISGFYDDNDYDDVILFITGAVTAVSQNPAPIWLVTVCLGLIAPGRTALVSTRPRRLFSTRAPPHRSR